LKKVSVSSLFCRLKISRECEKEDDDADDSNLSLFFLSSKKESLLCVFSALNTGRACATFKGYV